MVFQTPPKILNDFICDRGQMDILVVSGPDSVDFLNRLSTSNFKKEGVLHGAFLNGQAKLISIFTSWFEEGGHHFIIEKEMFEKTNQYLNQMHFAENLKIETQKHFVLEKRGFETQDISGKKIQAFNWGLAGEYYLTQEPQKLNSILESEYEAVRASFGFPKPYKDLTEEHILIEGPLDLLLDRNKGCYPGQEVVEKIYTYGRVSRKIKKIIFEDIAREDLELIKKSVPIEILHDGNNVGFLSSAHSYDKDFGLVTLKRLFYEKNKKLQIFCQGKIFNAEIVETSPMA